MSFAYDAANCRTMLTLANGITGSYAYDTANEVTGLTYRDASNNLLADSAMPTTRPESGPPKAEAPPAQACLTRSPSGRRGEDRLYLNCGPPDGERS